MHGDNQSRSGYDAGPVTGTERGLRAGPGLVLQAAANGLRGYAAGAASVFLITALALRLHLNLSAASSLYFLPVVMVSLVWGFRAGTFASLLAVSCLNYFMLPPVFSWRVSDPRNWVDLIAFEVTALAVSRLSTRVQAQGRAQERQSIQTGKLYELSRRILFLDPRRRTGAQLVALIHEIFNVESLALFDATSACVDAAGLRTSDMEQLARRAYFQDRTLEFADLHAWTHVLRLGSKPIGAIALTGQQVDPVAVASIASLAAIALERARSFEKESMALAGRQAEQLRTAVLDALAHAFKTPLTAILTASAGLIEGSCLQSNELDLALLIDEQAEHLNRLTTELLQMARMDSDAIKLRRERVFILTLIEDILTQFADQLRGRSVGCSSIPPQLEVLGDKSILATALGQFVDNASRYSSPGTPISISAFEQLNEVVIAFHNEGPAIGAADRERIFERFYRAPETRYQAPGTGLGLSIAKKAAEAHRGRTWVVSEEDTGTTFYFALPGNMRRHYDAVARQDIGG